jgi:hypothetical protein
MRFGHCYIVVFHGPIPVAPLKLVQILQKRLDVGFFSTAETKK